MEFTVTIPSEEYKQLISASVTLEIAKKRFASLSDYKRDETLADILGVKENKDAE